MDGLSDVIDKIQQMADQRGLQVKLDSWQPYMDEEYPPVMAVYKITGQRHPETFVLVKPYIVPVEGANDFSPAQDKLTDVTPLLKHLGYEAGLDVEYDSEEFDRWATFDVLPNGRISAVYQKGNAFAALQDGMGYQKAMDILFRSL